MKKNILKNKKVLMAGGAALATLAVIGGALYYTSADKFANEPETKVETEAVDTATQNDDTPEVTTPASDSTATTPAVDTTQSQTVTYEFTGVNKNNGDVFSLPDRIVFTISPAVDSARVRLLFQDGSSLYEKTVSGSSADLTVYPEKKLQVGSTGTIVIEGTKGGEVVATKEIKVVF